MIKNPLKFRFWHFRGIIIPLFIFLVVLGVFFTQKTASAKTISYTQGDVIGSEFYDSYTCFYQEVGAGWHDGHYKLRFKLKNLTPDPNQIAITISSVGDYHHWESPYIFQKLYGGNFPNPTFQDLGDNVYLYDLDLGDITGIDPNKGLGIQIDKQFPYIHYPCYPVGYTTLQDDLYLSWDVNPNRYFGDIKTNYIEMTDEGDFTTNNIIFTYPKNNSVLTQDFEYWSLKYNIIDFNYFYKTKVLYKPTDGVLTYIDEENGVNSQNYNPAYSFIAKSHLLAFLEGQTSRDWTATAYLIRCDDDDYCQQQTELASSTINFTIINPKTTPPTGEITTSTLPQITCDDQSGLFNYSLCKLFTWLFIPDAEILNKYSTLSDGIKNKPPIGYFYAIKNILNNLNDNTNPAFQLAQVSTLTTNIFNPLKTGISFILWLIFGFWIFNRIRYLEL
jgi:hypothetical protein